MREASGVRNAAVRVRALRSAWGGPVRPLLSGALLLATIIFATAQEVRPVFLDGVEMKLTKAADNNGVEISFSTDVPVHLRELGVVPGTMLVRGQWEENILVGEAWAFSKVCKPISYAIRGVVDYGGSLTVFGPVPTTCKVDDYGSYSWGKDAIMRFDQPRMADAKVERKGKKTRHAEQPKPKKEAKRQPPPVSASRVARPRVAAPAQPQPYWQQPYQQQWFR